jgi:SnoaL-like domain
MDGSAAPDVTLQRLHEIADAFARRDVDGIVNAFAEDGEFRNARGADYWGQSFRGKAAIRSYFEPLFASTGDVLSDCNRPKAVLLREDDRHSRKDSRIHHIFHRPDWSQQRSQRPGYPMRDQISRRRRCFWSKSRKASDIMRQSKMLTTRLAIFWRG